MGRYLNLVQEALKKADFWNIQAEIVPDLTFSSAYIKTPHLWFRVNDDSGITPLVNVLVWQNIPFVMIKKDQTIYLADLDDKCLDTINTLKLLKSSSRKLLFPGRSEELHYNYLVFGLLEPKFDDTPWVDSESIKQTVKKFRLDFEVIVTRMYYAYNYTEFAIALRNKPLFFENCFLTHKIKNNTDYITLSFLSSVIEVLEACPNAIHSAYEFKLYVRTKRQFMQAFEKRIIEPLFQEVFKRKYNPPKDLENIEQRLEYIKNLFK